MDALRWLEELRHELARRKLPRRYVKRLVVELSDHITDFTEDSMSTDAQDLHNPNLQSIVNRLGRPSQVAETAVAEYRRQRFSARHPLMAFVALPILLLPLLWIAFGTGVYGLLVAGDGLGIEPPDGPLSRWVEIVGLFVVYGMVNVPIVLSAVFVCRLASKAALGWKWPMLGCLLLAAVATAVYPYMRMRTADSPGLLVFCCPYVHPSPADVQGAMKVHVPRSAHLALVFQFAIPLIIGTWSAKRQATRHYCAAGG